MGVVGQFSTIYLMIELRAPAEIAGSVITICTCVGTLAATISPMIGQSGHPYIVIVPCALALTNFILSFCLIEPGKYLPQAKELSGNVTLVEVENLH